MRRGLRFEKSLAGATTLAARLVETCATTTRNAPMMMTVGEPMRRISSTGSQTASPSTTSVALVTTTPMKANAVMVNGSPSAWPIICARGLRA